jgi:hypothetical protein
MLDFLVTKLISLMGPIATLSKEKRELKDNALRAISTALQETKIYYRSLERDGDRNHDTEAQLVKYWGAAAIPLRHIDEELAMVCEQKSEFWIRPDNWSNEEIAEFGIKLQDVYLAYRQLSMPSLSKNRRFKNA